MNEVKNIEFTGMKIDIAEKHETTSYLSFRTFHRVRVFCTFTKKKFVGCCRAMFSIDNLKGEV